MKLVKL